MEEKLTALVKRAITDWKHGDASEHIAHHLIENGVIVQDEKWQVFATKQLAMLNARVYGVNMEFEKRVENSCAFNGSRHSFIDGYLYALTCVAKLISNYGDNTVDYNEQNKMIELEKLIEEKEQRSRETFPYSVIAFKE